MGKETVDTFCPASRKEWRRWLQKHHHQKQSVWLVYYKKGVDMPTVTYTETVEEALCFGWIDSTAKSLGDDRFMRFFCKRKPKSVWSKVNKSHVQRLIDKGMMMPAGMESIEVARQNGAWESLDDVEEVIIPKDLAKAFREHPGSRKYFMSLSRSGRKAILQWLVLARRPETREKRIREIAMLAAKGMKPKQF